MALIHLSLCAVTQPFAPFVSSRNVSLLYRHAAFLTSRFLLFCGEERCMTKPKTAVKQTINASTKQKTLQIFLTCFLFIDGNNLLHLTLNFEINFLPTC